MPQAPMRGDAGDPLRARAFDAVPFPMFVVAGSPPAITMANRSYLDLPGRAGDAGTPLGAAFPDATALPFVEAVERVARTREPGVLLEEPLAMAMRGTPAPCDIILAPLGGDDDGACAVLVILLDVTRLVRERDEAYRRVSERTRDLVQFNEALIAEMEERTRGDFERDALRRQLAASEEAERRRLARELHDRLGQHLTALALGLDEVAGELPPAGRALSRIAGLARLTTILTRDVRNLALELRPPELDDVGLDSAMATHVHQWSERYGIAAELEITGVDRNPGPEVRTAVFRIMQEALTNVARHADARHVSVLLERAPTQVRLIVEDDGRGFDVGEVRARSGAENRLGLAGMQERALLLHGSVEVESKPGRGTAVYARLRDVAHDD